MFRLDVRFAVEILGCGAQKTYGVLLEGQLLSQEQVLGYQRRLRPE